MTRRLEFTIIAGPNGAGKSKLGPFYSSVKAFDGDQLAMKLRKEHPDWKDSWIEGTVISTLMKEKDEAILLKKNYAFETNFSSDLPVNLIKDFIKVHIFLTTCNNYIKRLDTIFLELSSYPCIKSMFL